jgi:hypothetical protein
MSIIITEFVKTKFTGSRFESHVLPVDNASDLVAYQHLLVELAKRQYLKDNPTRLRTPKGFADVYLAIEKIEAGSSSLSLALIDSQGTTFQSPTSSVHPCTICFTKAQDIITDCINSPDNVLPDSFPIELLQNFNKIGRSLKDGETWQITNSDNSKTATLTQGKRKQLLLTNNYEYEMDMVFIGSLVRVSSDQPSFTLEQVNGGQMTFSYLPENFKGKLDGFFQSKRNLIAISYIGSFDRNDNLKKIISVTSLEFFKNFELVARFEELAELENGWFNGEGSSLNDTSLQFVAETFISHYPDFLPLPLIVPTEDGNLLFEWNIKGLPSIDINLDSKIASFQAFGLGDGDDLITEDFDLNENFNVAQFFDFLAKQIMELSE